MRPIFKILFSFCSAFFVATQFFFTLCFVGMLLAIAMVLMYLLCIDDYYRVKVLRWTGVDLLVSGASLLIQNSWPDILDPMRILKTKLSGSDLRINVSYPDPDSAGSVDPDLGSSKLSP
jgi:hypothetical protein